MITIIYKFIRAAAYLIGGDYKAISFVAITLIATMLAHYKEKIKAWNLLNGLAKKKQKRIAIRIDRLRK